MDNFNTNSGTVPPISEYTGERYVPGPFKPADHLLNKNHSDIFHPKNKIALRQTGGTDRVIRYVYLDDDDVFLIFTDVSITFDQKMNSRAGCAFVFQPPVPQLGNDSGRVYFRLEERGPEGNPQGQTLHRAALRAMVAVLQFTNWAREGSRYLVIGTCSQWLFETATTCLGPMEANGFTLKNGEPVPYADLWRLLLTLVRTHLSMDLEVLF